MWLEVFKNESNPALTLFHHFTCKDSVNSVNTHRVSLCDLQPAPLQVKRVSLMINSCFFSLFNQIVSFFFYPLCLSGTMPHIMNSGEFYVFYKSPSIEPKVLQTVRWKKLKKKSELATKLTTSSPRQTSASSCLFCHDGTGS